METHNLRALIQKSGVSWPPFFRIDANAIYDAQVNLILIYSSHAWQTKEINERKTK